MTTITDFLMYFVFFAVYFGGSMLTASLVIELLYLNRRFRRWMDGRTPT